MFTTISIITAVFVSGSQEVENPVLTLADNIRQSDHIKVVSFVGATLEAEPENISFRRKTEYTIRSEETIRHLATMVRARADAERRKTGKADRASTIYVVIQGFAKDSDDLLFKAVVWEGDLMFDRGNARYWVDLPPATGAGERSELYNRLSDMNFSFEDEARLSEEK